MGPEPLSRLVTRIVINNNHLGVDLAAEVGAQGRQARFK
jgi:hypothetical protein